ncbi:MAG TPA: YciI family protein [Vicinamibacterales bacterium]|nr:YciI family protein [Vicinamibacterales bacterium]
MYAVALIRYRRPLEEVLVHQDAHRAYLRGLKEKGVLIASGPMDPRAGGMCLLRVADGDVKSLDAVRDNDPFVLQGVAQYELIGWAPVIGKDDLDRL